jgi:hypothetical protein
MLRTVIMWLLIVAAVLIALWSLGAVIGANMAMWLMGFALLLAVLARMVQAGKQHGEVMRELRRVSAAPSELPGETVR